MILSKPPLKISTFTELETTFWSRVLIGGDDCWDWGGEICTGGYGTFRRRHSKKHTNYSFLAHRFAYQSAFGPIADDESNVHGTMYVCHACDNKKCVKPSHLFLGTQYDNVADMDSKGRRRHGDHRGELCGAAKLKNHEVLEIRRAYAAKELNQYQLAKKFNVNQTIISDITRRYTWKHI